MLTSLKRIQEIVKISLFINTGKILKFVGNGLNLKKIHYLKLDITTVIQALKTYVYKVFKNVLTITFYNFIAK